MLVGLGCLGVIVVVAMLVVIRVASGNTNPERESTATPTQTPLDAVAVPVDSNKPHDPMATPTYGLPPITLKLQNELIDLLNRTDELDGMIKRGCTLKEYASVFAPIEESTAKLQDALPSNDPRIYIFLAAMERYQALALKLLRNEPKDELNAADVLASFPKLVLLQVLNGTLDGNGEQFFDYAKQQIDLGKL